MKIQQNLGNSGKPRNIKEIKKMKEIYGIRGNAR
jgi:hypothetical protein